MAQVYPTVHRIFTPLPQKGRSEMSVTDFVKDLEINQSYFLSLSEQYPYPMQIFLPDGTLAIANSAFLREFRIPFAGLIEGKYNIFHDPTLEEYGMLDKVHLAFSGYPVEVSDIKVHVHSFKRFHNIPNDETELYYLEVKSVPIKDAAGNLACVVVIYIVKRKSVGRKEIALAKEYIEQNYKESFDLEKIANAASLSQYHFSRLFKKNTGMTPHDYYIRVRIDKLKQMLLDENLTVEQAFESCGMQYHGHYAMVFKKLTGLSPTEYKNNVNK